MLDSPDGYLGFANWETDPDILIRGLGQDWKMTDVIMKHYPSVISSQGAIDAIIDLMKEHNFDYSNIDRIFVHVSTTSSLKDVSEQTLNPGTEAECQFSLPYLVATAAIDGYVFLESYSPESMARQECP